MTSIKSASLREVKALLTLEKRFGADLPYLFGAADAPAGYHSRSDVGERTLTDGMPLETLWDEFNARLALFNGMHTMIEQRLGSTTTLTTERVAIPRRARMEEASEFERPTLIRTERVARGYPLVHYDIGFGFTQEFLDDATTEEVTAVRTLAEEAWMRRRRQTVYEALFGSANYTDKDGIAVKRLYNNDGEVPPEYESYTHDGTHTHYLGSASLDAAAVTTLETHLLHHGYGDDLPGGAGGTLYLHAPRASMSTIRGLTGWIPAESSSIPVEFSNSGVVVGGSANAAPGVQGFIGRFAVIEDLSIPANYLLAYASGGRLATQNPVRVRQHFNPSARGLRLNPGRNDYPLTDSFYDGYVGAGIAHRGAAAVMLTNNASYSDPTF
jgi:hypothetical protein